jgi:hypothetical protein
MNHITFRILCIINYKVNDPDIYDIGRCKYTESRHLGLDVEEWAEDCHIQVRSVNLGPGSLASNCPIYLPDNSEYSLLSPCSVQVDC